MANMNKVRTLQLKGTLSSNTFAIAATVLYFNSSAVRFVLSNVLGRIGLSFAVQPLYAVLLLLSTLFCLLLDRRRWKNVYIFLGVFFGVSLYFLITLLVHPDYEYYYTRETVGIWYELYSPVTGCIYALLVVLLCGEPQSLWTSLKYSAWIDLVYYTLRVLIASKTGHWSGYDAFGNVINTTYDLGVGYSIMFVAIIFLCSFMERKKLVDLFASIYAVLLVLNNGSRGALICLALCVVFLAVCRDYEKERSLLQKTWIVFLIGMLVVVLINFDDIVHGLGELLYSMGLHSRTVIAMSTGEFLADNGRNTITERALVAISEGGLTGLGAYGDRPYIAPYYWWGYCHNIALEVICDFGIIIGPVLLVVFTGILLRILFAPKSDTYRYVFVAFLSICGKMMVSDTIWGYPQFWALIGCVILYTYDKKTNTAAQKKEIVYEHEV